MTMPSEIADQDHVAITIDQAEPWWA